MSGVSAAAKDSSGSGSFFIQSSPAGPVVRVSTCFLLREDYSWLSHIKVRQNNLAVLNIMSLEHV